MAPSESRGALLARPATTAPQRAANGRGAGAPSTALRRPKLGAGLLGAVLAALVGFCAFASICGFRLLDTDNVGWLRHGDLAQYLIGWSFFRTSPWAVPPGLNPAYGLEIASSVFYSDSIPLFALLFKALAPLVEAHQYFGWWLLLCFVLQGVAGWLLMGLAVRAAAARLLGAALLCVAPPFLYRTNVHLALSAHWLPLFALWLAIAPPRPRRWPLLWTALLSAASLVHPYLLAMAGALWASDLLRRAVLVATAGEGRTAAAPRLAAEAVAVPAICAAGLWAAGFFVVGGGLSTGSYGQYGLNVLAPFDSDGRMWSRVLPDIPAPAGREAGSNFLGLGLLAVLASAALAWLSRPVLPRPRLARAPLLLALAGLAAFAVSHRVAVGATEHTVFPLPQWASQAAGLLRASERMAWPALYTVVLAGVAQVARRWGEGAATALLAAAVLAQAADGSGGWSRLGANLNPPGGERWDGLAGPFWDAAARDYERVRLVPLANHAPGWAAVGRWASVHGLPTDMVYLARVDGDALGRARTAGERALGEGRFDRRTLYVLGDPGAAALAALAAEPRADLLAEIDGLRVFAPDWKRFRAVPAGAREARPEDALPDAAPGVALRFGSSAPAEDRRALLHGWSVPEPHGRWSDGDAAAVALRLPPRVSAADESLVLRIEGTAFLPPHRPAQRVAIAVDRGAGCAGASAEWRFGRGDDPAGHGSRRSIAVPPCAAAGTNDPEPGPGLLRVRFGFPDAVSPRELGLSADRRVLAFALEGIALLRRGEAPP